MRLAGGTPEDAANEFGDEQSIPQAQCLQVGLDSGVGFFPLGEFLLAERPEGV
jgi:hypothetical protein